MSKIKQVCTVMSLFNTCYKVLFTETRESPSKVNPWQVLLTHLQSINLQLQSYNIPLFVPLKAGHLAALS